MTHEWRLHYEECGKKGRLYSREKIVNKPLEVLSKEWFLNFWAYVAFMLLALAVVSAIAIAALEITSWSFFFSGGCAIIFFVICVILMCDNTDYDELCQKYCLEELKECAELTTQAQLKKQEYEFRHNQELKEKARRVLEDNDSEALYEILKEIEEINGKSECSCC